MKTLCFNFIAASILLLLPASLEAGQQDEGTDGVDQAETLADSEPGSKAGALDSHGVPEGIDSLFVWHYAKRAIYKQEEVRDELHLTADQASALKAISSDYNEWKRENLTLGRATLEDHTARVKTLLKDFLALLTEAQRDYVYRDALKNGGAFALLHPELRTKFHLTDEQVKRITDIRNTNWSQLSTHFQIGTDAYSRKKAEPFMEAAWQELTDDQKTQFKTFVPDEPPRVVQKPSTPADDAPPGFLDSAFLSNQASALVTAGCRDKPVNFPLSLEQTEKLTILAKDAEDQLRTLIAVEIQQRGKLSIAELKDPEKMMEQQQRGNRDARTLRMKWSVDFMAMLTEPQRNEMYRRSMEVGGAFALLEPVLRERFHLNETQVQSISQIREANWQQLKSLFLSAANPPRKGTEQYLAAAFQLLTEDQKSQFQEYIAQRFVEEDKSRPDEAAAGKPEAPTSVAPSGFGGGGFSSSSGIGGGGSFGGNLRQVSSNGVMITWSEKNDELRGFSTKLGDWEVISIPPQTTIVPIVSDTVAAVRIGDSVAAFSGERGWWDVIELSKGSKAVPVLYQSHVQIEDNGHLYTFASEKGVWTSPTDPELRPANETISPRFKSSVASSPSNNVRVLKNLFEEWRNSLPKYKARGISILEGNSEAHFRTARQRWMTELKAWLHELFEDFEAASSAKASVDATTQNRTVTDLEVQMETLQVELNALRSAKPETSDASTKQPDRVTLRKQVEQAFDVRQQLQELEAQKLRLKLQIIEANLATRQKNRERIVERRVEELLDPNGEATKWNSARESNDAADRKPITGSPIGLAGPPHLPLNGAASISSARPEASAPASVQNMVVDMKWRQPSEVVKSLRNGRDQMAHQIEKSKWPQEQVDKYSRPLVELIADGILNQGTDEVGREALLKSSQDDLNRHINWKKDADRDWHQAWSQFQSQLRLLRLDVEAAESILSPLEQKHARLKPLTESGAIPVREFRQLETELPIAKIQLRRAEELLQLYADIEKNEPQLNPDYKAPAADEATNAKPE